MHLCYRLYFGPSLDTVMYMLVNDTNSIRLFSKYNALGYDCNTKVYCKYSKGTLARDF